LHETGSPLYDAQSASTRNISTYLVIIAAEKSALGETNVTYYSDFWYWPSLDKSYERPASTIHINMYMVIEKCQQKNNVSK